jgi:hypothetical protein
MTDADPAKFLWLLRPPVAIDRRTEKIFLLVGAAALFAGYDVNIYGLATPQIQATFHIPENQVALTLAYFRIAALFALALAASADLVGRRRLLLFTIFGQGLFTLATAFAPHYWTFVGAQFFTRIFGYAEEMLLFVVVAEEITAKAPIPPSSPFISWARDWRRRCSVPSTSCPTAGALCTSSDRYRYSWWPSCARACPKPAAFKPKAKPDGNPAPSWRC